MILEAYAYPHVYWSRGSWIPPDLSIEALRPMPVRRVDDTRLTRGSSLRICETRSMDDPLEAVTAEAITVLREAGARFAYLHGSRATGQNRANSDVDIAAYFGDRPPNSFDVLLPLGWTCSSSTTRRLS
jgi:hypothetical protein